MKTILLKMYQEDIKMIKRDHHLTLDASAHHFFDIKDDSITLKSHLIIGKLDVKNSFSFLLQKEKDIYLDNTAIKDAMDHDIVLVDLKSMKVVFIIDRALKTIICEVRKGRNHLYWYDRLRSDYDINCDVDDQLVTGHIGKLNVKSIENKTIQAAFVALIGHKNDPDIETKKLVSNYDWPTVFPEDVLQSIHDIKIDMTEEIKNRHDFTKDLVVTIDGEDAKDLDDAIGLVYKNNHYFVSVHIADVSHFVKEDTLLDQSAYQRATSVYLADRVIPMLPHKLSNDWCSLNPNELKLTLSCIIELDEDGEICDYQIVKSVIKSTARLTYTAVNQLLHDNTAIDGGKIDAMLYRFHDLSLILKKKRNQRGEIEFNSPEIGFKVDENGKVIDVYERITSDGEALIESMMLLANEVVAKHMSDQRLPNLYRIHEIPSIEKLLNAFETLKKLSIHVDMKKIGQPKQLQMITRQVLGTPLEYIVHMQLLRSMQKAKYSEINMGHFGLGATHYSHFTSPIRRYPDLYLHRLIHQLIIKDQKSNIAKIKQNIHEIAEHTSLQERKSIDLERDVNKLKSFEFMADKIGQTYQAVITQMMPSGMFVRLQNGIEGFLPLRLFQSYLRFDETQLLYQNDYGTQYRLGQPVMVKLVDVNKLDYHLDFIIVDDKKTSKKKGSHYEANRYKQKSVSRLSHRRKI